MEHLLKPLCPSFGALFDGIARIAGAIGLSGLTVGAAIAVGIVLLLTARAMGLRQFVIALPQLFVTGLIVIAICNLLIGVFLRYVVGSITYTCDLDNVRFTWVEEVGEMALAWLALVGAAIGVRSRAHFTLAVLSHKLSPAGQIWLDRAHHVLIIAFGMLAAWFAVSICRLNWELATPGLEISVGWLYLSAVVGGLLIAVYALSMIVAPPPHDPNSLH